jgi:hypothetical protein
VAMSLDGFTAGPNVGEAEPMGEGGERLHEWMWMTGDGPDGGVDAGFRTVDAIVGAAVIGRRTFDLGVGPWAARRGLASRASWSPTGPGRTCPAITAGASPLSMLGRVMLPFVVQVRAAGRTTRPFTPKPKCHSPRPPTTNTRRSLRRVAV